MQYTIVLFGNYGIMAPKLTWTDSVIYLSNYLFSQNDDLLDCTHNKSMFMGYVNKLISNYGSLQHNVLMNLFK